MRVILTKTDSEVKATQNPCIEIRTAKAQRLYNKRYFSRWTLLLYYEYNTPFDMGTIGLVCVQPIEY